MGIDLRIVFLRFSKRFYFLKCVSSIITQLKNHKKLSQTQNSEDSHLKYKGCVPMKNCFPFTETENIPGTSCKRYRDQRGLEPISLLE